MAARCVQSDGSGGFRFLALPPGEYVIALTVHGLELPAHTGVRVGPGETVSAPITMTDAPEPADVTVEGSARALDRFATTRSVRLAAEELVALPDARSMGGLVAISPAVL